MNPVNLGEQTQDAFIAHLENNEQLTKQKVARLRSALLSSGQSIDLVITELGFMREIELTKEMSNFCGVKIADPKNTDVSLQDLNIPKPFLEDRAIVPMGNKGGKLQLLMADPFDEKTKEMVAYFCGLTIEPFLASRSVISEYYKAQNENHTNEAVSGVDLESSDLDIERLQDVARDAPIVRLVAQLIQNAIDQGATDIHIEPAEDSVRVRYRIDGVLSESDVLAKSNQAGVTTRIKILSGLNISERRLPQDGRMRLPIRGQSVDFRTSVIPSVHGETIVLRILDRPTELMDLAALGFETEAQNQIKNILSVPNGIFLVTGPTGSGKTTTLYAILNKLKTGKNKIFTIEDPVEYRLDDITQLQVNPDIDLDFPKALRSVLRQDPDIILIGEIRDAETAKIAVQAALTGHLVLSTLHTNSAVGAVTRLRDMGVEDFLIGATLRGALGQRLVRKKCNSCKAEESNCPICNGSKYKGRTCIYEIMETSSDLVEAVNSGKPNSVLENVSNKSGKVPLEQFAKKLVQASITTHDEVSRVTSFEA